MILRNIKILIRKCLSERQFSRLKVYFTKTILKRVHISNKHHKSHVWPKNLKKKKEEVFFSNFGLELGEGKYLTPFFSCTLTLNLNILAWALPKGSKLKIGP